MSVRVRDYFSNISNNDMNKHIIKSITLSKEIWALIKKTATEYVLWYKEQSKKKQRALAAALVLVLVVIVKALVSGDTEEASLVTSRQVVTSPVSLLASSDKEFPLIGTVTSVSEAVIRSESGGRLTRVAKKLGDTVYAGDVIASFDNASERASLLQAEGAYEQAKASRDITKLQSGQAGTSLVDAKSQALNAISNAYTTLDDAVTGKTDSAFSDPEYDQIKFLLSVPDATLSIGIETKRKQIAGILAARALKNKTLTTSSDLVLELGLMQNEAQVIKSYLDDLFTAYSKALPNNSFTTASLETGKANVQSARQSVSGVVGALVSARGALTGSITASEVAGSGASSVTSGTLATAEAQVKQALGAYNAALARLEKTIIRSPITGTLNSLTIQTGDYVGAFTQVAVVSNNGALEVVSNVTEDDAKRITIGSPVTINTGTRGVVTRIASAIDPTTRKIEVRIGITDAATSLVNGQSVRILITKNKKDIAQTTTGPITIPIASLKLTPRGAMVFTVTASNTLVALPVKEGAILGEQIQIIEGLTGTETIVTDARGLKEGMEVTVKE